MKEIYLNETKSKSKIKAITKMATHSLTKVMPKVSKKVALKVLCNPASRREYDFRTSITPKTIKLETKMGEVNLFFFEGGDHHIFLSHGWADSTNRFTHLINHLIEEGYSIWSIDHIGHGKSFGDTSHLFGYIDGLKKAFNYIEDQGVVLEKIVTHSMGGVALLNFEESFLENKKIVIVSAPVQFFESMFESISKAGISKKMLLNLLESISDEYGHYWENLRPMNQKHKIDDNFLFIHDEFDPVAKHEHITNLINQTSAKLLSTQELGHVKILKDQNVFGEISLFLGN